MTSTRPDLHPAAERAASASSIARRRHRPRQAHDRDPGGRRGRDGHPDRRDVGRHPLRLEQGDQPAFGYIDTPTDYQFINGVFEVFGWASDFQLVQTVEVDIDGHVVGNAFYGLNRPDVRAVDPRVFSNNVGFSFLLDTTHLSDSPHDLVIYVIDRFGNRTEIGRRKFVVNNNVVTHN